MKRLGIAMALVGGMISGALGSVIAGQARSNDPEPSAKVETSGGQGRDPMPWVMADQERRLRSIEDRVAEKQLADRAREEASRADQGQREAAAKRSGERAPEDPDASRARAYKAWEEQLALHKAEPEDRRWAPSTAVAFSADLRELSADRFELTQTQCRSTSCSAQLRFADYATALENLGTLIHHRYRTNCATETALPPPAVGRENAPYEVTMLYDCTTARAGL